MKGSACYAPHVVVFGYPAQGHVNGAMDLSRKLALLGVSVTFVCTEAYINSMLKQGFDAGGLPIRLHGLPDGLPQEKSITDSLENTHVSIRATENMGPALEELLNKLNMNEEGRVVCVVYDLLLWWVGRLGKELHIPAYIFNPMSSSFCSYVLLHIPVFVLQGRLPLGCQTDLSDKSNMFKIPDFPSLHVSEVPDISWDPNPVCPFDFIMRCATRWHDATGMLLNTVYELEKEVVDGLMEKAPELDIKAVGPILPASFLKGEMISDEASAVAESADVRRCFRWLDEQPAASVLYIAFGTIACLSEAQTQELAMGLEASKERFLWVMRIPDQQQKAGEERITRLLRSGFEERTAGRGMVLWELAPQRRILAHRAIAGFLTHCGWNSTLEALCKGVPMLCCPMFGDQGMNSKWVDEIAHTGKLLKREGDQVNGIVSRDEVERTTREVISTSSTLRSSAARIRDVACHAALDATGSSSKNLQAFVDTLSSRPIPA